MTMYDAPAKTRPTYGYYRQPDGWITASPATDTDELQYRRGGWIPLKQYGNFEMSRPYSVHHPLEVLFMRGGAHELTEEQIRQQGLYLDPPVIPNCKMALDQNHMRHVAACLNNAPRVVFPQLAGMTDLGPFPCRLGCDRPFPTTAARNQHETVMHAPEKSDIRTGESLADALTRGLQGSVPQQPSFNGDLVAELAAMRRELAEMKARQQAPVAPRERPKTRHTHGAPFGVGHLVAGCPRCAEMSVLATA